jgi:hypothetical protein
MADDTKAVMKEKGIPVPKPISSLILYLHKFPFTLIIPDSD